jgi:hypothetical protein
MGGNVVATLAALIRNPTLCLLLNSRGPLLTEDNSGFSKPGRATKFKHAEMTELFQSCQHKKQQAPFSLVDTHWDQAAASLVQKRAACCCAEYGVACWTSNWELRADPTRPRTPSYRDDMVSSEPSQVG